jgi:prepilin-type N-terminal cleavage/methylation domain-containing protein
MKHRLSENKKGFSLVELLTVVIIIGISIGLFYTTFYYNWLTMNTYTARADLMQEMDQVIDVVTEKVREADDFTISTSPTLSTVTLSPSGQVLSFDSTGQFLFQNGPSIQNLSYSVDSANSSFTSDTGALNLQLTLREPTPGQDAILSTFIQVYPRNRNN